MRLRKPRLRDDDLLDLPPLDGDDDEPAPVDEALMPLLHDDGEGADDSVAGEGFDDPLPDEAVDVAGLDEALDGPDDDHDGYDEMVVPDDADEGDDAGHDDALEAWFDEAPGESADDLGEEGVEDVAADLFGALPPMDDDDDDAGDATPMDDLPAQVRHAAGGFALEEPSPQSARVRLVRGATVGEGVVLGVAVAMTLAEDGLWAVGDAVARLDRASFDDEAPAFVAVDAPGGEVFTGVAVRADGIPMVATLGAEVLVATRRGSWRPLGALGPGRAVGPTRLHFDGVRVWCVDAQGGLHLLPGPEAPGGPTPAMAVTAATVDQEGGFFVASAGVSEVCGYRVDAQAVAAWRRVSLPPGARPAVASLAGDLIALAGSDGGWWSVDGGQRWHAGALLQGATALAVVHSDDGAPGLLVGVYDARVDRSAAVFVPVQSDGALGPAQQVALPAERRPEDGDESEGDNRIEQIVALDPAGRRVAVLTGRGTVWLIDRS